MAAGLGAIRLPPSPIDGMDNEAERPFNGRQGTVVVDLGDDDELDIPEVDTDKGVEIEGGGVIVRIGPPRTPKEDLEFEDNLAEAIPSDTSG